MFTFFNSTVLVVNENRGVVPKFVKWVGSKAVKELLDLTVTVDDLKITVEDQKITVEDAKITVDDQKITVGDRPRKPYDTLGPI